MDMAITSSQARASASDLFLTPPILRLTIFFTGNVFLPKLVVYTSQDLMTWKFEGFLHNNTAPGWAESGRWKFAPNGKNLSCVSRLPSILLIRGLVLLCVLSILNQGTWWSPSAVWSEKRKKMILWWSATTGECCEATFGVAESSNGIHFDLVTLEGRPGSGASVDGSSLLIDDDGRRVRRRVVSHGDFFHAQSQRLCCFHGDES
jgi:hypothetical protein